MNKKNAFFTFCLACIPGTGAMYLGYMKRGMSQLLLCSVTIMFSVVFYIGPLALLLPVIFAYCFFDTWHLRDQTPEQAAAKPDDYIIRPEQVGNANIKVLLDKRHTWIGWGCIIVAGMVFYDNVLRRLTWRLEGHIAEGVIFFIVEIIPTLAVVGALVLLGMYLLRKPRTSTGVLTGTAAPQDEYVAYTGTHADNAAAMITQIAEQAEVPHGE